MSRSTSVGSPYLMEPDYRKDSSLWGDSLLRWSDHSEYLLGRYVQIHATSTRYLHLGHVSLEGLHVPAAGHNPIAQTSRWEGQMAKGSSRYERSGATGSSDGPSHLSATSTLLESTSNPYQQLVQPLIRTPGPRVSFDSSATKPAPTGSWDTDVHGRQATQGRDDDSRPASHPRGAWEGSSIRKTGNLKPRQEGGCPIGASRNIPSSSTHGKPSPQPGGAMKASPGDPLRNLANYRSTG